MDDNEHLDEEDRIRRVFGRRFEDDVKMGEVRVIKQNVKTGKTTVKILTMEELNRLERNIMHR